MLPFATEVVYHPEKFPFVSRRKCWIEIWIISGSITWWIITNYLVLSILLIFSLTRVFKLSRDDVNPKYALNSHSIIERSQSESNLVNRPSWYCNYWWACFTDILFRYWKHAPGHHSAGKSAKRAIFVRVVAHSTEALVFVQQYQQNACLITQLLCVEYQTVFFSLLICTCSTSCGLWILQILA